MASAPGPPLFVPVEIPTMTSAASGIRIELEGAVVALPPDASQALITTIIRAVLQAAREQPTCVRWRSERCPEEEAGIAAR